MQMSSGREIKMGKGSSSGDGGRGGGQKSEAAKIFGKAQLIIVYAAGISSRH